MLIEQDPLPTLLIAIKEQEIKQQVKDLLEQTYKIIDVASTEEALNSLCNLKIDFMIVDHAPGEALGFTLCKQVKTHKRFSYLPILLIMREYDPLFAKEALDGGVTNFLYHPLSPHAIHAAIMVAEHHKNIVLELTSFSQKLKRLAEHDPLTNFYNRYVLYDHGRKEIDKAIRGKLPLSLLMIDIDHFKEVNDLYGHLVGDEVLVQLAELILKTQRSYDLSIRFGGEEFAILLPNTSLNQASTVAEKIRLNVSKTPFITTKGIIHISISAGVAMLAPEKPRLELLLQDADEALYEAKIHGRNQVRLAS
ncbi:MAG: diguanylate cyclase [Chlamydiales bacterium]|nr:diguanylate cyclase [Chlamydiales bacterium]